MAEQRDQLQQILRDIQTGRRLLYRRMAEDFRPVARRLREAYNGSVEAIQAEIQRLEIAGRDVTDLTDLLNAVRVEMQNLADAIQDIAQGLQNDGVEAGYRHGLRLLESGGVFTRFNQPTLEAIQAAINYADQLGLVLDDMADYYVQRVQDLLIMGVSGGRNPRQIAGVLAQYFASAGNPLYEAERIARTLQLYAMREGNRQIYERNGITHWIWIANIGNPRTCMACVAKHGTRHPITELLNDHMFGRCTAAPETPRWTELGLAGGSEVSIQTGLDWFIQQDYGTQRQVMGARFHDAWLQGRYELTVDNLVSEDYEHPVFGVMHRRRTLNEILGRT